MFGGAYQVLHLIKGLQKSPQPVQNFLLCQRSSDIAKEAAPFCQEVFEINHGGDLDARLVFRVRSLAKKISADFIHIHSRRGADLWGILGGQLAKVPVIVTRRVDNLEPVAFAKWKYQKCAALVGISQKISDILADYSLPIEKIQTIRSGVDLQTYQPTKTVSLAELFSFPSNRKTIGVIAQLIQRKGHHVLLASLPNILEKNPDTQVILFGKGKLREELEQQIKQRKFAKHITFAGFREDLPQLIPALDLVVHPALMEGLGVSLMQASACGVPIIASAVGGIPEIVIPEINGITIPPEDPSSLSHAINQLLSDDEKRKDLSEKAIEIAHREFSIEQMIAGNRSLYTKLASANSSH